MCRNAATNIFLTFWQASWVLMRGMCGPAALVAEKRIIKNSLIEIWNYHLLLYLCSVLGK